MMSLSEGMEGIVSLRYSLLLQMQMSALLFSTDDETKAKLLLYDLKALLAPSVGMLIAGDTVMVDAHVKEIVERVLSIEDINPSTDAEVLAYIMAQMPSQNICPRYFVAGEYLSQKIAERDMSNFSPKPHMLLQCDNPNCDGCPKEIKDITEFVGWLKQTVGTPREVILKCPERYKEFDAANATIH